MQTDKKIKLLDFKLTKNLGASLFGAYKSRFTGTGVDFIKHKEYTFGDSIKNIDWKTISKTDKVYTKVFEDERDLKVLFLIDINKSMDFGVGEKKKKDIMEELFYSISLSSSFSGDSIGAYIFSKNNSKYIDFEKGFTNIFRVFNEIDKLKNENGKQDNNLEKSIEYILKLGIKDCLVFILTDDTNIIESKSLKLLSIKNELIFLNIFDYFENNLSLEKVNITFKDINENFLNIDLSNEKKVNEYKKYREEKLNNLKEYMKKNKISYKAFDTSSNTFMDLYLFFNKEMNIAL